MVKDGWNFIRPKDHDPVYKALKIGSSDLYRNGLTDLRNWTVINLKNGVLKEGTDYFFNLLDVKHYWKDNLKPKEIIEERRINENNNNNDNNNSNNKYLSIVVNKAVSEGDIPMQYVMFVEVS